MSSISLVFLTYNNYEKFFRCMNSMFFFFTERRVKEILILDNGSYQVELKDYLRDLENQISKVRVVFSHENLGIGKGRKFLFNISTGDYIISMDSDIVVLNPPLFLEVFYRSLEIENMMLVGGGGGDHPFFPSMERESIDNKDSPDSIEELKVVDEVAGWFTGFKSSILKKNGGEVEMDERFSPFWAEDSDFCVQIKLLGGKCCIMGKGLVAHQWSSCGKKETQTTLEEMWNKFQDKWYPKFGKKFIFDMDEEFYEENYPECKQLLRRKEFYLKIGIMRGDIYSKDVIKDLFKEAYFKDNKNLVFPEVFLDNKGNIRQEDKNYTVEEFNKKFMNQEKITKQNFQILRSNLDKNFDDLIIIVAHDENICLKMLKSLVSLQEINVCVCVSGEINYYNIVNFLEKFKVKSLLCVFKVYQFDLISFSICYKELRKIYNFKRILNLSTYRDGKFFLSKPLREIETGGILEEDVKEIDKFNISLIGNYIALFKGMSWNKECVYFETKEYYDIFFNSYPFREIFDKCLKITKNYSNYVTPRCSPYHSLERIFGFMKHKINDKKSLCIVSAEINFEDDIENLKNNLKFYKNCEILVFNKGEEKHIKTKDLGCDFHYPVNGDIETFEIWKNGLGLSKLEDFNNILFTDDSYTLKSDIDEFLERSRYKNLCHTRTGNKFDLSLFSIVTENLGIFMNHSENGEMDEEKKRREEENKKIRNEEKKKRGEEIEKEEEKDIYERIATEVLQSINCTSVWNCEKNETEEEIVYEYKKEGKDLGEDYPME